MTDIKSLLFGDGENDNCFDATTQVVFLTLGIVVFLMSSAYWANRFLRFTFLKPYFILYFICGAFHAWNIRQVMILADERANTIPYLIALTLLFTGWYNAVLMPMSGIGFMQIAFTFFVLTADMVSQMTSKKLYSPFSGQNPMTLFYFGCVMYFFKVLIFYMFQSNIYDQMFLGNGTGRFLLFVFVIMGIVMLFGQLSRNLKNQFTEQEKSFVGKGIEKVFAFLGKIVKFVIKTIKSLLSPAILVVVILLLGGVGFFFSMMKFGQFYNDIMGMIEPLMRNILSTGENQIVMSVPYFLCQLGTFFLVFLATASIDKKIKACLHNSIEEEMYSQVNVVSNENNYTQEQKKDLYNKSCSLLLDKDLTESFHYKAHPESIKQIVYGCKP